MEIHEPPVVGPNGEDLVAGDVITLEPGVYRQGFGGCRHEDLVLVTDNSHELLTDFPYDL
jgi:Xaa-Pro aminopeptidase